MSQLLRVATAVRRILQVVFATVFLAGCTRAVSTVPAPTAGPYDVVIENGLLVNGTGNPWMYGNVGIRSDRIVAITPRGALHDATARQRVDTWSPRASSTSRTTRGTRCCGGMDGS